MKCLILFGLLALCYSMPSLGRNVNVGADGTVTITESNGKKIVIYKSVDPIGNKHIEISVEGPHMPPKVVKILDEAHSLREDLPEDRDKRSAKKQSSADILSEIFLEHQGPIDEKSYQKILKKIQKEVEDGKLNPEVLRLLEDLEATSKLSDIDWNVQNRIVEDKARLEAILLQGENKHWQAPLASSNGVSNSKIWSVQKSGYPSGLVSIEPLEQGILRQNKYSESGNGVLDSDILYVVRPELQSYPGINGAIQQIPVHPVQLEEQIILRNPVVYNNLLQQGILGQNKYLELPLVSDVLSVSRPQLPWYQVRGGLQNLPVSGNQESVWSPVHVVPSEENLVQRGVSPVSWRQVLLQQQLGLELQQELQNQLLHNVLLRKYGNADVLPVLGHSNVGVKSRWSVVPGSVPAYGVVGDVQVPRVPQNLPYAI